MTSRLKSASRAFESEAAISTTTASAAVSALVVVRRMDVTPPGETPLIKSVRGTPERDLDEVKVLGPRPGRSAVKLWAGGRRVYRSGARRKRKGTEARLFRPRLRPTPLSPRPYWARRLYLSSSC